MPRRLPDIKKILGSLRFKLFFGFIVVNAMYFGLAVFLNGKMQEMSDRALYMGTLAREMAEGPLEAVSYTRSAQASFLKMQLEMEAILHNKQDDTEESNKTIAALYRRFNGDMDVVLENTADESARLAHEDAMELAGEWMELEAEIMAMGPANAKLQIAKIHAIGKKLSDKLEEVFEYTSVEGFNYLQRIEKQQEDTQRISDDSKVLNNISQYLALFAGLGIAFFLGTYITDPIKYAVDKAQRITHGDFEGDITTKRKDEMGMLINALAEMQRGLRAKWKNERKQARENEKRRIENEEKAKKIDNLTARLGESVSQGMMMVLQSAEILRNSSDSIGSAVESTSEKSARVLGVSEQVNTNVQSVSDAATQLSNSISEIASNASKSASIAGNASQEAERADKTVQSLADAATKIGDVVTMISDITGQINLLALNATIEAARAGEAGKGFAVVANEVKNLASQTASATEEITSHIVEIQNVTNEAVSAIQSIVGTIQEINNISSVIASAVEEQGSATSEIAANVQNAARSTHDVTSNISVVSSEASSTRFAVSDVLSAANDLSAQATMLKAEVEELLDEIRHA